MTKTLVIKNGFIVTIDKKMSIIKNGFVVIRDDKIEKIGNMKNFPETDYDEVINASGLLVMPGLVNTHTHLPMILVRGLAEDLRLQEWLQEVWKYESRMSESDIYNSAYIAALESIKSGVTCVHDMYFKEEMVLQACKDVGIRAVLSYGMIDVFTDNQEEKRRQELKTTRTLLKEKLGAEDRLTFTIAPHAPNTCTIELLTESQKLAKEYSLPIHIHIAETKKELEEIKKRSGKTIVQYLDDLHFFEGVKVLAAHCVWLEDEDIEIFRKYRVNVSHNPSSNLKLGSGIARIPEMLESGINISLGTDGAGSNNNLSILTEMRLAGLIQKGTRLDSTLIKAKEIVKMATINGAKALGLDHLIGSIEIGKKADLVIFDLKDVNLNPFADVYSQIVYSLKEYNLVHVIIDGRILFTNNKFIKSLGMKKRLKDFFVCVQKLHAQINPKNRTKIIPLKEFF